MNACKQSRVNAGKHAFSKGVNFFLTFMAKVSASVLSTGLSEVFPILATKPFTVSHSILLWKREMPKQREKELIMSTHSGHRNIFSHSITLRGGYTIAEFDRVMCKWEDNRDV